MDQLYIYTCGHHKLTQHCKSTILKLKKKKKIFKSADLIARKPRGELWPLTNCVLVCMLSQFNSV